MYHKITNTDTLAASARDLRRKGMKLSEIAEKLNVNRATISRYISHLPLPKSSFVTKKILFTENDKETIFKLYQQGDSFRVISEKMGRGSIGTIRNICQAILNNNKS